MFNLLVTYRTGAWDQLEYAFAADRYLEHTSDGVRARYQQLTPGTIASLMSLPTIFAYEEDAQQPARLGRLKTITGDGSQVSVTFEIDSTSPPIHPSMLKEMSRSLGISEWELSRTHWAVKEAHLGDALAKAVPRTFRRQTIINACGLLRGLSHSELDGLLLELGVDGLEASRSVGSLAARTNAIASYVLEHQDVATADGEPLGRSIVVRAAMTDAEFPSPYRAGADRPERIKFWAGLNQEGYAVANGVLFVKAWSPSSAEVPTAAVLRRRTSWSYLPHLRHAR